MNSKYYVKELYIVDNTSYIFDFQQLKETLIEEIKRETIENNEDKDIVKSNLELLEKIHNDKYSWNESFIVEELKSFGYVITKVNNLIDNLVELKNFLNSNNKTELENKVVDLLKDIQVYFINEVGK